MMVKLTSDVYVNPDHVTTVRQDGPSVVVSLVSGKCVSVSGAVDDIAKKLTQR